MLELYNGTITFWPLMTLKGQNVGHRPLLGL